VQILTISTYLVSKNDNNDDNRDSNDNIPSNNDLAALYPIQDIVNVLTNTMAPLLIMTMIINHELIN
jgi:hypothetical protein